MRPIIEYQGPLFQLLHRVVIRLGYDNSLWLWRLGAVGWLVAVGGLTFSTRLPRLFTLLLLGGVVLLRVPGLGLTEQNVDESQWIASAATLVQDPRFWHSVDGTTSGPLNVWPLMLIYYLGSSLDYTTLRLWGLLTCVLPTVWLLLATFRYQFGERVARLAILPAAVCLAFVTELDAVAFNSEQFPMMLLALAGYLISRILGDFPPSVRVPNGGWLVLGLTLGSLPYTKLQTAPIGLVLAVIAIVGLLMRRPGGSGRDSGSTHRWHHLSWLVAGGLLPTIGLGIYLFSAGLTDYAVRSYLITNLAYAQEGSWAAGTISWIDRFELRFPVIYGGMFSTRWFWGLTLYLFIVWGLAAWLTRERDHPYRRQRWLIVLVLAVSMYAVLQPGNPFMHYQWLSFVPASWLIGNLLGTFTAGAPGLSARQRWLRVATATGYLYFMAKGAGWLLSARVNPGLEQLARSQWSSPLEPVSEAIRQISEPNQTLVIWGWANSLHVETGLLMGSRFIPLYFPVVAGPQQAYFLRVYQQDLLVNRPAVIVDAVGLHVIGDYTAYPIRRYPTIQAVLDTRYRLVKTIAGAKIYALRP